MPGQVHPPGRAAVSEALLTLPQAPLGSISQRGRSPERSGQVWLVSLLVNGGDRIRTLVS